MSNNNEETKGKRSKDPHAHVKTVTLPPTVYEQQAEKKAKDGFSLKKYSVACLNNALQTIRAMEGVTVIEGEAGAGTHQEAAVYQVGEGNRRKLILRYIKKSRTIQLQGDDKNPLFDKLAAIIEGEQVAEIAAKQRAKQQAEEQKAKQEAEEQKTRQQAEQQKAKTAQQKSRQQGGQRSRSKAKSAQTTTQVQPTQEVPTKTKTPKPSPEAVKLAKMLEKSKKTLRKLIPTAFEMLPEQCINDLSIGCADIVNNNNKLTDYSALLLPPFRGLEKFIQYLQIGREISVKMIGQAYERNDAGEYMLKSGYRKKINSVVYAEVMAALYTTYFNKRNYYSHSDYGDSQSRHIVDRKSVQQIFMELLDVIEYNARKLQEINFVPTPPKEEQ